MDQNGAKNNLEEEIPNWDFNAVRANASKKWNEAVEKAVLAKDSIGNPAKYDFYFGNTGIVDIYKKEGKSWFWNIYKDILNLYYNES